MAVALVGVALGALLMATAALGNRYPRVRTLWRPAYLAIVVLQLLDGATTWVGVNDPFGFHLPPYQEQVLLSAYILETWGGLTFFIIKGLVGVVVVLALDHALRAASAAKERHLVRFVHVAVLGSALIPVVNNVNNFQLVA